MPACAVRYLPTRIVQFRPGGFHLGGSAWAEAFGRAGLSGWHAPASLGALIFCFLHYVSGTKPGVHCVRPCVNYTRFSLQFYQTLTPEQEIQRIDLRYFRLLRR